MTNDDVIIRQQNPEEKDEILALYLDVLGPGCFARTAYRIREGSKPVPELSFLACRGTKIIGAVSFTEISVGNQNGALFLGPLAVATQESGKGYGHLLISAGLGKSKELGFKLVLLVGDLSYYSRTGFQSVPYGNIIFPGPVDPRRLLAAELVAGSLETCKGEIASVH